MNLERELATVTKLKGVSNYPEWEFELKIIFEYHGVYEIVSGQSMLPDRDDKLIAEWKKKDANGKRLIILTVENAVKSVSGGCGDSNAARQSEIRACSGVAPFSVVSQEYTA